MAKEFYSNGKLLLTAEYAILDGAKGLALPTKFGQYLKGRNENSEIISWTSIDEENKPWFNATFSKDGLKTLHTTDRDISKKLVQILSEAKRLNPSFLSKPTDFTIIESKLTFPRNWGLGSSSTLIANIAEWAQVDPYKLLASTFGGSGYDIACAENDNPIVYQKKKLAPIVKDVHFKPTFSDRLFFIYLNQKKNSRDAINAYRNLKVDKTDLISKINKITEGIIQSTDLNEFEQLLNDHENLISKTLQTPTIKEVLFPDYKGSIKSLGAWGGDFILATGKKTEMEYFTKKGFTTVLPYTEMIL